MSIYCFQYTSFKPIFKAIQKLHVGKPMGICFCSSNNCNQRNNTDPTAVSGSFTAHCFQKFFQLLKKFLLSQQALMVQTAFQGFWGGFFLCVCLFKKKGRKKEGNNTTDQRQIYDCITYTHINTSLTLFVHTEEINLGNSSGTK